MDKLLIKKTLTANQLRIIGVTLFILMLGTYGYQHCNPIKDRLNRFYKNFNSSIPRQASIEMFAGCQPRTMMEEVSDEKFSQMWEKDTATYDFDYQDVMEKMMSICPPHTPEEVEMGYSKYQKSYQEQTGKTIDESQKVSELEKINKMIEYQKKFINREFSTLKE